MTAPHTMQLAPVKVPQTGPGRYEGRIQLLMPASWAFRIAFTGENAPSLPRLSRLASLLVDLVRGRLGDRAACGDAPDARRRGADAIGLPDDGVLWAHGLAAMGWILGGVVMAVALASDPSLLDSGVRARLSRWYRRFGESLHWGLVPVIVATGIYNMRRVTAFSLAFSPGAVRRLVDVPYGALYESILIVKLGLFAVLLSTGTQVLRRSLRPAVVLDQRS